MPRSYPNSVFLTCTIICIGALALMVGLLACATPTSLSAGNSSAGNELTINLPTVSRPAPGARWVEKFVREVEDTTMGASPAKWVTGGGAGYGEWITAATITVTTKDELLTAIAQGRAGDVVYVDDDTEIDLTGVWDTRIPAGVTLAGGRGRHGSLGALLYTRENITRTLFDIRASGVRITGLRLQGPSTEAYPGGCPLNARGITVRVPSDAATANSSANPAVTVEIDNNDLWGWPNSAISVVRSEGTYIHHNYIHHNRRVARSLADDPVKGCATGAYGLGYGVNVTGVHVHIDANLFDHNRHDIASDGSPNSGYTARYNLVMPNTVTNSVPGEISHSFDMHGYGEQRHLGWPPPYAAGDKIVIHHNTFLLVGHPAIVIRGEPASGAWIYQNQFVGTVESALIQRYTVIGDKTVWPKLLKIFDVENNEFSVDLP